MKENLEALAKLFDARAKMLRNHAANIRWSNYTSAFADQIEAAETAYRICMEFPGFHQGCLPCLFLCACCIFHLGHIRHRLF